MTKEEALKGLAYLGAVWFGNSKQHFAFSAYDRLNGWNKLADKWKEEAEEEWDEAEEVLNRLVELGRSMTIPNSRSRPTTTRALSKSSANWLLPSPMITPPRNSSRNGLTAR